MSRLMTIFIALIAVIVPLNKVASATSSSLDINQILELIQQQQRSSGISEQHKQLVRQESSDFDSDSDSDNDSLVMNDSEDNNRYARLGKKQIIDLIKKNVYEKSNKYQNDDQKLYRTERPNYVHHHLATRVVNNDNSQPSKSIQTKILEHLLNKGIIDEDRKKIPKQRLKPSSLIPEMTVDDLNGYNKHGEASGLEDYSKVYIVLNPEAVRNSKNQNSLNELISKVLALSSPPSKKERHGKRKPRRYKGFLVNDDQLPRRKSKELFVPQDSIGDEYQLKPRLQNRKAAVTGTSSYRI